MPFGPPRAPGFKSAPPIVRAPPSAPPADNAAGTPARNAVRGAEREIQDLCRGETPSELAPQVALKALRLLDRSMSDYDSRVALEAARVVVQSAGKMAELLPGDTAPDPEAKRAALLAACASEEFCTLLVTVVASSQAPARLALERAGWVAP